MWRIITNGKIRRIEIATGTVTDGTHLYVSDFGAGTISRVVIASGAVAPIVSSGLSNPEGLTSDGINLYLADFGNNLIKKLTGP
jgi:hypothetical protein